jgi:hypothetical protein
MQMRSETCSLDSSGKTTVQRDFLCFDAGNAF